MNLHHPPPNPHRSPGISTYFNRKSNGSKGESVTNAEQRAKTTSRRTGAFATLSNLLRAQGTGAPSRRARAAFAPLLALGLFMALTAAPASALQTHVFKGSFGAASSTPANPYPLSNPSDVAVDETTGDIYASDPGDFRIEKFSPSGAFLLMFGKEVNKTAVEESATRSAEENVCPAVGHPGDTCQPGTAGTIPGAFESSSRLFVAVDNSGSPPHDVYVADTGTNLVQKFAPDGTLASGWGNNGFAEAPNGQLAGKTQAEPFTEIAGIAVDSAGTLDVFEVAPHALFKFAQAGAFSGEIGTPRGSLAVGLAVDPSGNFYKANGIPSVEKFHASGADIGQVSAESAGGATGLAVDPSNGQLFVDVGTKVDNYTFNGSGEVIEPPSSTCVIEESVGCNPTSTFGASHLSEGAGLAVDGSTHTVFAADPGAAKIAVFDQATLPDVSTGNHTNVTETTATLHGTVNPDATTITDCHFDYGTNAVSYGHTAPCDTTPSGSGPVSVSADIISGLQPATTYHYRLQVTNTDGTANGQDALFRTAGPAPPDTCPNAAFRQGLSASLPDCRAYEQVTPSFKDGVSVLLPPPAISSDGSKAIVSSIGNFGDAGNQSGITGNAAYGLTRTSAGWSEASLDPLASQFPAYQFLDTGSDLSKTLWAARATSQSINAFDLLVRDADGTFRDLGPVANPSGTAGPPGLGQPLATFTEGGLFEYRGASSDLSHVLYTIDSKANVANETSHPSLWPGDTTAPEFRTSLYEYTAGLPSEPVLVGVKNNGPLHGSPHINQGAELISNCGTALGSAGSQNTYNAVSTSGETVYFTAEHNEDECLSAIQPAVNELYARIDGSQTVAISEPTTADCSACNTATPTDANFQGASRDGSKVFFLSEQELLSGAAGLNLYEYDFHAPVGEKVSLLAPEMLRLARISDDGSHIYFVAKGVIPTAPNPYGVNPLLNANNLYLYERDAAFPSGHTAFIGRLSSDSTSAQATPDGRFLVFSSAADLTPDDTSTASQVFRYDAQTRQLIRVSIGQEGFNSNGNTNAFEASIRSPNYQNSAEAAPKPTAISNDGSYVVFESADGLTPEALNGVLREHSEEEFAANVYEYHGGNVYLISDGHDATGSGSEGGRFPSVMALGTTASGSDVFFTTTTALTPTDTDTVQDIYDARIGGGFPFTPPISCQGDTCQGPSQAAPSAQSPGSAAFSGPGNLHQTKCKKGFVRKHGKCVKKHHKRRHHKRAGSNRGGQR